MMSRAMSNNYGCFAFRAIVRCFQIRRYRVLYYCTLSYIYNYYAPSKDVE